MNRNLESIWNFIYPTNQCLKCVLDIYEYLQAGFCYYTGFKMIQIKIIMSNI